MAKRPTPEEIRERTILDNSLERVINTTIRLLEGVKDREHREELRHINLTDWQELKYLASTIWNEERNRILAKRLAQQKEGS